MSGAAARGRTGGRSGGRRHAAKGRAPGGALLALISHTLRLQTRGVAIWGLALGLYGAAIVATFTTFDARELDQVLRAFPEGLLEAFGVTELSTVEGWLSSQVFTLAPLALAFFPILAAAGAIAGSEERGTMDVLLGNPIRRWQLVVGSFAATALSLLGILAVAGLLTWGTAVLMDVELSPDRAAAGFLNLWPVSLLFGGVAMLCSAVFHRRSLAVAVPGFLLFAMYLLDAVGKASENLEGLRPWSVFYYYGAAVENGLNWANFAGILGAALALVLLAVVAFQRRDIYT